MRVKLFAACRCCCCSLCPREPNTEDVHDCCPARGMRVVPGRRNIHAYMRECPCSPPKHGPLKARAYSLIGKCGSFGPSRLNRLTRKFMNSQEYKIEQSMLLLMSTPLPPTA